MREYFFHWPQPFFYFIWYYDVSFLRKTQLEFPWIEENNGKKCIILFSSPILMTSSYLLVFNWMHFYQESFRSTGKITFAFFLISHLIPSLLDINRNKNSDFLSNSIFKFASSKTNCVNSHDCTTTRRVRPGFNLGGWFPSVTCVRCIVWIEKGNLSQYDRYTKEKYRYSFY